MRVLAVGVATLDIVNSVPAYPMEDAELRAEAQEIRPGGNAANTLGVLRQLGHECSWAGTLADDPQGRSILEQFESRGIDTHACRRFAQGRSPVSYIILSRANGSRTIVHYRDLPEYPAEDFARIDIRPFDWIHFEGRNVAATQRMLNSLKRQDPLKPISLEVEKERDGIAQLFPLPDVLLFSRAFAEARGWAAPDDLFSTIRPVNPQALLICAWGEEGAWLQQPDGRTIHVPAYRPARIVDTLGAGDVLNAGVIDGLVRGLSAEEALTWAVRWAGIKCGQQGLDGFVQAHA